MAQREPVDKLLRAADEKHTRLSLHVKILAGYMVLGGALVGFFSLAQEQRWDWSLRVALSGGLTLVGAVVLPSLLGVSVRRLSELENPVCPPPRCRLCFACDGSQEVDCEAA